MTLFHPRWQMVLFLCFFVVGCGPTHTPEEEASIAEAAFKREVEKAMKSDQVRVLQESIATQKRRLMYAQSVPQSRSSSGGGLLERWGGGGVGEAMARDRFQQLGEEAAQEIRRMESQIDRLVNVECWKNYSAMEKEYIKKHQPSLVPDGF